MVGVSSEVASGGVCAFGVALARAFGVFEEVEVEDFGFVEVPAVVGHVHEVAGYYNLVEEVPLAFVCEGAYARVEFAPPGVEETVGFDAVRFLFSAEDNGTALVLGVVVEVAHYYDSDFGVDVP